jgi:hypothetical protein
MDDFLVQDDFFEILILSGHDGAVVNVTDRYADLISG